MKYTVSSTHIFFLAPLQAEAVRKAVAAWGLTPYANKPSEYSDTITAVRTPPGYDGQEVVKIAYQKYNLSLGSGLMKVRQTELQNVYFILANLCIPAPWDGWLDKTESEKSLFLVTLTTPGER